MSRILVYFPLLTQEDTERLSAIAAGNEIKFIPDGAVTQEDVDRADIILGSVPPKMLHEQPIKLMQLASAGADAYVKEGLLSRSTTLCCCTGAYSQSVAEHAFGVTLMLMKNLHLYRDRQNRHQWLPEGTTSSLNGATVIVTGLGDIGRYYARLVKAMGAYVIGVKRRPGPKPDYVDELCTTDEFDSVVSRGDVILSVMPSTPETIHFFTKDRFRLMKKSAIFLNCGRGTALDLDVIYQVLSEKLIAAAGLDVFETEPLPEDSPLWGLENLMITPHSSGFFFLPVTRGNVVDILARNLEAFLKGGELMNVVDFATGYKK